MYTKARYNILRHTCCFTAFSPPFTQLYFEIIMRQWKTKDNTKAQKRQLAITSQRCDTTDKASRAPPVQTETQMVEG